jgi:nucleotidyltransferase substrate binding protein (TIGR01987 family)
MDLVHLQERIGEYLRALRQLESAIAEPLDEFVRDSIIRRFEFTFEEAWQLLQARLALESIGTSHSKSNSPTTSPEQVLQSAVQAGLIHNSSAWAELQENRKLTSHTHQESVARAVHDFAVNEGLALYRQLAVTALQWQAQ